MITNERQYRISRAEADRFRIALNQLEAETENDTQLHPVLRKAEVDGLRSQLGDLENEIHEYEELKEGKQVLLEASSLEELPEILIKARIAAGVSQRKLAENLEMKEQQIQRYEATRYRGANLARLREVASALGVRVSNTVFLTKTPAVSNILGRLSEIGLDKRFVLRRLVPAATNTGPSGDSDTAYGALSAASHVYGWTPEAIAGTRPLFVGQGVLGAARFKVTARSEEKRLAAYTFYAHFLSMLVLQATDDLPQRTILTDAAAVRREIMGACGEVSFKAALGYVWDLGIPVIPLRDPGAFHGALWRVEGRNVIVLKQRTTSLARWLHDLIHELWHAGVEPEQTERTVLEAAETSEERRNSDEEWDATAFAADVVLDGRAEEIAKVCVNATRPSKGKTGRVELLKSVVPKIARREGVPVGSVANYLAFRLGQQGVDWWGAAQNLQDCSEDPWQVARDVLLQRVSLARLTGLDRRLLMAALADDEDSGNEKT